MNTWTVAQGADATFEITIVDGVGQPITEYTGSEPLAGQVWPGDDLAPTFALVVDWADPDAGTVSVGIAASNTQALGIGTYRVQLTLLDGERSVAIYEGVLEVTASPGEALQRPVYCTYNDMLKLAPWIGALKDELHDQTGFAEQRAAARERLDNLILRSYRGGTMGSFGSHSRAIVGWHSGAGPRRSLLPSDWLRGHLESGALMVTGAITRMQAHWAIADVCTAQIGRGGAYTGYGAWHRREGDQIAAGTTAELDTNDDGRADIAVPLGITNTLFT